MRRMKERLEEYLDKKGLELNAEKTKIMKFRKERKKRKKELEIEKEKNREGKII